MDSDYFLQDTLLLRVLIFICFMLYFVTTLYCTFKRIKVIPRENQISFLAIGLTVFAFELMNLFF